MEISAVSCILGIISTLAARSRGVLHVECVMESVYASGVQQHPSPAFSSAQSDAKNKQLIRLKQLLRRPRNIYSILTLRFLTSH